MLKIGCHLSVSNGFEMMAKDALSIGANTFQFFTRNPRGSKAKQIDLEDIKRYNRLSEESKFSKIVGHAPYTLNICSLDDRTREFALEVLEDDMRRMELIPYNYYNFHPGSHTKQGVDVGVKYIADAINKTLKKEHSTTILLETMSGKGTEVGRDFEELKRIIESVHLHDKVGVCLDTCHVYDAGYDIKNDLNGVLEKFDKIIGLDKLYAIHLNDSKNPFNSKKDRHECIGKGFLGIEALTSIINHKKLRDLPFILETPNEISGHKEEIELLKSLYKN